MYRYGFKGTVNQYLIDINMKLTKIIICFFYLLHCNIFLAQNNEPFVVIDGKLANSKILEKIDAKKIASINVLKGAQAATIYGKEAINGVIEAKTKTVFKKEIDLLFYVYGSEFKINSNAKNIKITGYIFDCENIVLPNITVTNLNSKETFKTDIKGKFIINVHRNDVLEFSELGFISQRYLVAKKTKIKIILKAQPLTNNPKAGEIMVKKPVIYLYPTQKTDIVFSFRFNGQLQTTFPKYDKSWDVTAYPNGQIFDKKSKRFYNSLFWDGNIILPKEHYDYKDGFMVSKDNLTKFLFEKLEYIGLNNSETNDFVQYWLPILEKNENNFIRFYINEDYKVFSTNNISPKPETAIRVFMEFYNLEKKINIPEQKLIKTERKGFTIVEWGGCDVNIPIRDFNNL